MHTFDDLRRVPGLADADIEILVGALLNAEARIQRVMLSRSAVWIKRYGTETRTIWHRLQSALSRVVSLEALRPSPFLPAARMAAREIERNRRFKEAGFPAPDILYASEGVIVLSDVGQTVQDRLDQLWQGDPDAHDELLVRCACELGRLHAAGLCHGRPYPRDMFFSGGRIGFMDFEEEPQTVMPMAVAQARDIWLLFMRIAGGARKWETRDRAYIVWSEHAPVAAIAELRRLTRYLGGFLTAARLIGRVHMGSDLQRFIVATSFLLTVCIDYHGD